MKKIFKYSALLGLLFFFSCQSDDFSVFQDIQPQEENSKITVTQNELFLPESVSEIGELETAVFIKTEIPKANIYLNQIYQGKSPIKITNTIPGYYTLSVEFERANEQTVIKNFLIEIKSGEHQNYYIPVSN
ncbi:MAG: PEGA domain-containing protein [Treponema sp.]